MNTYERHWWRLKPAIRAVLERWVAYYVYTACAGNRAAVLDLLGAAKDRILDVNPVTAAIMWRLWVEVSGDE